MAKKYSVTFRAWATFEVIVEASSADFAEDIAFHCCDTEHLKSHKIEETVSICELIEKEEKE